MRHVHSSSRYDAPLDEMRKALGKYVSRDKANVITLTEMNKPDRRKVLADFCVAEDFDVVQAAAPEAGDSAILIDTDEYVVLRTWARQLTQHEQRRGPGGPPPPHCITALVCNRRTGKKVLISVAHLPSHVEGSWFDRKTYWRVFVWRDAHRHWKQHLRRLRRKHRAKVVMVADWNLNLERKVFRALLRSLHPGLRLTWERFPGPGTHHGRVIDGTLTNLPVLGDGARLLPDDESSDHRPYFEALDD